VRALLDDAWFEFARACVGDAAKESLLNLQRTSAIRRPGPVSG
jgi:hypothetical protein